MEKFLRGPTAVLVVSDASSVREAIAGAIDDAEFGPTATADDVLTAESADTDVEVTAIQCDSIEAAIATLASTAAIGTVVVDDSFTVDDLVSFVRTLSERWPTLPTVVTPTDGSERLARDVTANGSVVYYPDDPEGEDFLETVGKTLREHDGRYRQAIESDMFAYLLREIDTSIYVKDDSARHLKKAATEGSPSPETAIGKTDHELYESSLEDTEQTVSDDKRVIEGGESIRDRLEEWEDAINDRSLFMRTTKIPWRRNGTIQGLLGMSMQVTETQSRIQELEAKTDRLEEFTSYVSHDLRNPLQVAAGNVELARETDDLAYLARATEGLERVETMLDELDTLRESVDAVDYDEVVDFVALVRSIWRAVDTLEATLIVDVPDGTTIDANGLQIRPLFENLFTNAIRHAGEDVTVRVGTTADGFFVEDDGPGISPDDSARVFEEGFTTGHNGEGTGLKMVADLAASHGWEYSVTESSLGGARFEFRNCLIAETVETMPEPTVAYGLDDATAIGCDDHVSLPDVTGSGDVTITSAGADVGRQVGEFAFVYRAIDGPVRIQTRIDGFEQADSGGKAGVTVRAGLDRNAPFSYVGGLDGTTPELFWRPTPGDDVRAQDVIGRGDVRWYRLDRQGKTVTVAISTDGEDWVTIDRRAIALADPVYVGLAVASPMYEEAVTATFAEATLSRLRPRDDE